MIDYLIYDKKNWTKRSSILKVINFLTLKDFSRPFFNSCEFISNLF